MSFIVDDSRPRNCEALVRTPKSLSWSVRPTEYSAFSKCAFRKATGYIQCSTMFWSSSLTKHVSVRRLVTKRQALLIVHASTNSPFLKGKFSVTERHQGQVERAGLVSSHINREGILFLPVWNRRGLARRMIPSSIRNTHSVRIQ